MFNIFREYANPDKSRLAGDNYRRIREWRPQFMEMVTAVFGHGYNENWERKPQFMGSSWNLTG